MVHMRLNPLMSLSMFTAASSLVNSVLMRPLPLPKEYNPVAMTSAFSSSLGGRNVVSMKKHVSMTKQVSSFISNSNFPSASTTSLILMNNQSFKRRIPKLLISIVECTNCLVRCGYKQFHSSRWQDHRLSLPMDCRKPGTMGKLYSSPS